MLFISILFFRKAYQEFEDRGGGVEFTFGSGFLIADGLFLFSKR